jgi:hypothetical protein
MCEETAHCCAWSTRCSSCKTWRIETLAEPPVRRTLAAAIHAAGRDTLPPCTKEEAVLVVGHRPSSTWPS